MEDSPEAAYNQNQYDRVTEVTAFVYSQRDDMFTRARRYFHSEARGSSTSKPCFERMRCSQSPKISRGT